MARSEPGARVMMGVDGAGGDAVSLARHWVVPVAGDSDTVSRVDGLLVYGFGGPCGEICRQQRPENAPGSAVV